MYFDDAQYKQRGQTPILILVGILVLVAVAGGAYFLGKQATPKTSPSLQPTTVPQASPTPNETATWKTYTNTMFGFQFQYPPNSYLYSGGVDPNLKSDEATPSSNEIGLVLSRANPYTVERADIKISIEQSNKTARQKAEEYIKKFTYGERLTIKDTTFASLPAVEITNPTTSCLSCAPRKLIVVSRGNLLLIISDYTDYTESAILSAFKFIQ